MKKIKVTFFHNTYTFCFIFKMFSILFAPTLFINALDTAGICENY